MKEIREGPSAEDHVNITLRKSAVCVPRGGTFQAKGAAGQRLDATAYSRGQQRGRCSESGGRRGGVGWSLVRGTGESMDRQ